VTGVDASIVHMGKKINAGNNCNGYITKSVIHAEHEQLGGNNGNQGKKINAPNTLGSQVQSTIHSYGFDEQC